MNRAISLPLKGAAWLLLVLALPFPSFWGKTVRL